MKKVIFLGLLTLCTAALAANYCPCPGPCCPYVSEDTITEINTYLATYTTTEKMNEQIEKDLAKHRVI